MDAAPREVQGERRLAHRGTRGDDDHLPRVQAVRERVEVGEPRGHAGHLSAARPDRLDLVEGALHDVAERQVVLTGALLGDRVDLGLRAVDDLVDVVVGRVSHLRDARARLDQPAQHRALVHDLGVVRRIGRRGHRLDEVVQVGGPADLVDLAALGQLGGNGDGVGRLTLGVDVEDGRVDGLVGRLVEVVALEDLDHVGDGVLGQQHAAQNGLLGLEVLRRHPLERRAPAVPATTVRAPVVLLVAAPAPVLTTAGGGQTITGAAVGPRVVQGLGNAHRATSSRPPSGPRRALCSTARH